MAAIPSTIGKYRVDRQLGEGGMGTVYLAHDEGIDRHVAIKLLRADNDDMRRRFRAEAKAVGKLKHPNIVTVYDYSDFEGSPCIVMEYVEGDTVATLIRRSDSLSIPQRLYIVEQVCRGLAYAHRAGIVHRDIKPSNLMVDREGAIKIVDFGIARTTERGLTRTGGLVGTPSYMSPEQIRGEPVDRRCDIFAIGIVLYELLTGQLAFPGDSDYSVVNRIVSGEPEPFHHSNARLTDHIKPVLDKALAKDPDNRFQDADQLADRLAEVRLQLGDVTEVGSAPAWGSKAGPTITGRPAGKTVHEPAQPATPFSVTNVLADVVTPRATTIEAIPQPARVVADTTPPPPRRSGLVWAGAAAVAAIAVATALWNGAEPAAPPAAPPASAAPAVEQQPVVEIRTPAVVPAEPQRDEPIPRKTEVVPPVPVRALEAGDKPSPDRERPEPAKVDAGLAEEIATAGRLFEDGEFARAEAIYRAVLKADPQNAAATSGVRAIDQARKAEAGIVGGAPSPDAARITAQLGEARKQKEDGDYDAAIKSYEVVLKLDASNAEARAGIAETRKLKAAEDEVLKKLKKPGN
jgi:predicted Ser/Thr protein kinase